MTTPGREQSRALAISISSGSGTGNITKTWELARRVRVIPVAEANTFDVAIKDADGHLIFQRTGQLGTLSELQELSLGIAGSVVISNASADGTYQVRFDMH